jgi:4a-hydroxytetrahydrobiopterin dehydratase
MTQMTNFSEKKCKPCEGSVPAMSEAQIKENLKSLSSWDYRNGKLQRAFPFKNYYQTTSFVNAVAWIAHQEDHHPDIEFGYKECKVNLSTHAVKGISENDFIVAAKINKLLES